MEAATVIVASRCLLAEQPAMQMTASRRNIYGALSRRFFGSAKSCRLQSNTGVDCLKFANSTITCICNSTTGLSQTFARGIHSLLEEYCTIISFITLERGQAMAWECVAPDKLTPQSCHLKVETAAYWSL